MTATRVQVVCNRVCRNLGRAEQRDHADDQNAAELEQAVFQPVRDADLQNAADERQLGAKACAGAQRDRMIRVKQQHSDNDRCNAARKHRGERRARDAPLEHINQDRVADQVDHVDQARNQHGNARVALRTEQRRTGVINRKDGVGEYADGQIGQRTVHYVILDRAEQQPQQRHAEQHDQHSDDERDDDDDQIELAGCVAGAFALARTEQLRHHDRAAGRKGGKNVDDQNVQHIDQRHAGHRRLANRGYHDGIRQADRDREHLLKHKRPNQLFECGVRK